MRISPRVIFEIVFVLVLAVSTKGQASDQKALENNIRDLYGGSPSIQLQASRQLVSAGSRAIPLLVPIVCETSRSGFDVAWPVAARALGELKAQAAAPCLLHLLVTNVPPAVGSVIMKSNATLAEVDPAFAALLQIGEPTVPAIRHLLPLLHPDQAIVAIRVLKAINTPDAKEAADAYIKFLEQQLRLANEEMEGFSSSSMH